MLPKLDKDTTTSFLVFLVEDVIENRIQVFGILDENGLPKRSELSKLLDERVVQETRHGKASLLALLLQELCHTTRRIDDEGVSVESFQDDRVFRAEVINWQRIFLPSKSLVRGRKVFCDRIVLLELIPER